MPENEEVPEAISDVATELSAATAKLGHALNPQTAANLAGLVRIMNTYYSNLIEGHNTRRLQADDGPCRHTPAGRSRRPGQPLATGFERIHSLVSARLPGSGDVHGKLFEIETLAQRLRGFVERSEQLKPQAARLLEEALTRGQFDRGDVPRITGLPERTARRVFNDVVATGLLASETPKGPMSLRFPFDALDVLFPRLFPEI